MEIVYSWLQAILKWLNHAFSESKIQTRLCLLCHQNKSHTQSFLTSYLNDDPLCYECRNMFVNIDKIVEVDGLKVHCLMRYDESFQKAIVQYKECYDEILKDIFLFLFKDKLKKKYKNTCLVPAPSSFNKLEERGFSHFNQIYSQLGIEIVECFVKTGAQKQAFRNKKERSLIKEEIQLIKLPPNDKKIVLIDDVCTTGSTILAMRDLLLEENRECEALVLAAHDLLIKKKEMCLFDKIRYQVMAILKKK